jgi:hypothetical protein
MLMDSTIFGKVSLDYNLPLTTTGRQESEPYPSDSIHTAWQMLMDLTIFRKFSLDYKLPYSSKVTHKQ